MIAKPHTTWEQDKGLTDIPPGKSLPGHLPPGYILRGMCPGGKYMLIVYLHEDTNLQGHKPSRTNPDLKMAYLVHTLMKHTAFVKKTKHLFGRD